MRAAALVLLVGCGGADGLQAEPDPALDIQTWVEGKPARGVATLAVQVTHEGGLDVRVDEPKVPGLRFTEVGQPEEERLGAQLVVTRRYRFSGQAGSYEIPALQAAEIRDAGDTDLRVLQAASDPIWVDVGAEPPALDGFADIEDPPPVFQLSNAAIVGVVCVGIGGLGVAGSIGLAFFALSGRKPSDLPPEAPDVVALRRWNAVRSDPDLDDHDKAVAIAAILREYIEAVLGFPATAWTTSEILEHLGDLSHLPEGNVGRARRVLRATDRIKFADAAARETLFEELDDALRTFIASTRPRAWDGDGEVT